MPNETLQLPRPLVNQLLHQAQQAAGFSRGFVRRDANGRFQCRPLAAAADVTTASVSGCAPEPFAFYRSSNVPLPPLTAEQVAVLARCTSLSLDIALDTQGVLQLRAWRLANGQATPLDVGLMDSEEFAVRS